MVSALLLPARWGRYGKEPGQIADYCLLDGSGGADLTGSVQRLIPGTPSVGAADDRAALPWVTVGGFAVDGAQRLGIALVEWPAERRLDHFHRPTTLTRYYEFDLRTAEEAHAGFETLYEAVVGLPLPVDDDLTAPVVATDVAALAERIDAYGFENALGIAASMLDSPVLIVGSPPGGVRARLRVLDMLVALLPSGLRADLVAGTWVPEQGRHKIRLGFGRGDGTDAGEVRFGEPVDLTGASDVARQYFDRVAELGRRWRTRRVVESLWQEVESLSFADPGAVLTTLARLDHPYAMAAALRRGTVDLAGIRRAVASCPLQDYGRDVTVSLLTALIQHGSNDDLALLRQYWSPEVRGWLVDEAARAGVTGDRASACASVAYGNADLEPFAAELCRRAILSAGDHVRVAAVEVLTDREPFAAGTGAAVWQSMVQEPGLCLRLFDRAVARRPFTADGWLRWLTAQPDQCPPWMLALAAAANPHPGPPDARELERIGGGGPVTALRLAINSGAVGDVLTALWASLINTSDPMLVEEVRRLLLTMPALPVHLRPRYDVLLIHHGGVPRLTPATLVERERASYLQNLGLCLRDFTAGVDRIVGLLVGTHLRTGTGNVTAARATVRFLVDIADLLNRVGRENVLRQVAEAVVDLPDAITELPRSVRDEMFTLSVALRRRRALDAVGRVASPTSTADPAALAKVWLDAEQEGVDRADVARAAARWSGVADPERVLRLIEAIEAEGAHRSSRSHGIDLYVRTVECVVDGHLGAPVAELRKLLSARVAAERRRWERIEKALKPRRSARFGRGKEDPS